MGHVFVAHGDLTKLVCDHWLLPVDSGFGCSRSWRHSAAWKAIRGQLSSRMPDGQQVFAVRGWTHGPRPWPTNVAGGRAIPEEWHAENVREFLIAATAAPPMQARARPLLALPIVGTGYGGKRHVAGDILRALMPVLYEHVAEHDVDVVLVAWTEEDFAAAQAARRELADRVVLWPDDLRPELVATARALAVKASTDQLVVFMGSGISAGAGLPTWGALLDRMASEAGFSEEERAGLWQLDPLDRATVIGRRIGDEHAIGAAVTTALQSRSGLALAHSLIAGLPVREFITTNYDDCFEQAAAAIGRPVARLPYAPASGARRWLLKMHGCVSSPRDIVLTRQDYVRYAERSAALAGIVQAMLITRHMLFVGFSLDDDNFHRIVDAVRRALSGGDRDSLGSAVALFSNPLVEQLWGDDLEWLHVDEAPAPADSAARATALGHNARRFEIFLDCLSFHASSPRHLLSPRFEGVLTGEEKELRSALLELRDRLARGPAPAPEAAVGPARAMVDRLLTELGDLS